MQNSPVDPGTKEEEINLTGGGGEVNENGVPDTEEIPEIFEKKSKGGGKGGLNEEDGAPAVNESEETDSAGGSAG